MCVYSGLLFGADDNLRVGKGASLVIFYGWFLTSIYKLERRPKISLAIQPFVMTYSIAPWVITGTYNPQKYKTLIKMGRIKLKYLILLLANNAKKLSTATIPKTNSQWGKVAIMKALKDGTFMSKAA
jgi:hypothetical protein